MQDSLHLQHDAASGEDKVEVTLRTFAQNVIAVVFGILPLFFVPVAFAPFDYSKTFFVIIGLLVAVIAFSLSVLRSGRLLVQIPWALVAFWSVGIVAIISALLSGDLRDAFLGDTLNVQSAVFTLLLIGIASIASFLGQTKKTIMLMYTLLTASAVLLGIFHLLRIVFGADFATFGVFTGVTATPLGGWNDLGLFFGLSILLSLVALEQLPLTRYGKYLFAGVVAFSLAMLMVVNFFAIWLVLGLVSLVILMYTLTKDRFSGETISMEEQPISLYSIVISAVVFVTSLIFIIGGSAVGGFIADKIGVNYVEVRPSLSATMDIARNVYSDNAFVGIGPNRFVDAWRLYKDPSINQTIFWATDFGGGSGYVTTQFVTNGIFSIIAWVMFFALFLFSGFRMLFRSVQVDRFWYFIGSSSFIAAVYLWGMSFFYNPSATILLLAAIFTSTTFAAYAALSPVSLRLFTVNNNRRAGFALVGVVMVVIIGASSALYYTGRHYASVYAFGSAISGNAGNTIEAIEQAIASAYAATPNDVFARQLAAYQVAKMNTLLTVTDPTPEQQQAFQTAAANGINAAQLAVNADPTDPQNWSVLGSIYSILAAAGVDGASEKAQDAFTEARRFDPNNPSYALQEAQLASRTGDTQTAREKALEAVQLKSNYTDALLLLTQLDIAEGNTEDAAATTRAMISLEPNNPARYYQLGVLESSLENEENAIAAFERAVALDPNYANARYFLALAYAQQGRTDDAIAQLEVVRDLNPDNTQVQDLIDQLRNGVPLDVAPDANTPQLEEASVVSEEGETVTTTEAPDTSLVTPVNTVSNQEDQEDLPSTTTEESVPPAN